MKTFKKWQKHSTLRSEKKCSNQSAVDEFIDEVRSTVKEKGFVQDDKRFNRTTYTIIGHVLKFTHYGNVLNDLWDQKPLPKYSDDYERMSGTFLSACKELKDNPESRRGVVLNTDDYLQVYPCFLSMQFVQSCDGRYECIVYQRSGDLAKAKDDITYFVFLLRKFEDFTGYKIKTLVVVYGNLHFEVDK